METPDKLGYFMPSEWAKHGATWLSWPKNPLTFPARVIKEVEQAYCSMISALSEGEKVKLLVDNSKMKDGVLKTISDYGCNEKNIIFHKIKSADVWIRDYGLTYLLSRKGAGRGNSANAGENGAVKWIYNAYGGKYDDLAYDNITGEALAKVADREGARVFHPGIVLEGGSIEVDGEGTLLTTEQCLLNKNRNPDLSKAQIENYLREYTGAKKIVWLKSGIDGDDTDGHVDDFARFFGKGRVLCAGNADFGDKDGAVLRKNLEILNSSADASGSEFEVINLPMPKPLVDAEENRRLPASYANFYIGSKVVLLPVFGDRMDKEAASIMQSCFPNREIIPVSAGNLVFGYGGIHCVTQQEPAAPQ